MNTTMTFESIYKKYNGSTLRYFKSRIKDDMIAEELASDVMIKVHKSLNKFDEGLSQMGTWITNIAKNTLIDHFRKKTQHFISLDFEHEQDRDDVSGQDRMFYLKDSQDNPEENMITKELEKHLYSKYEKLNESEKIVAALHYFDGLSYEEVAEELNMPLGTIKAKLHRARTTMMTAFPQEIRN